MADRQTAHLSRFRRATRARLRLCLDCPARALPDRRRCLTCLTREASAARARMAAKRAAWKAAGRCRCCGARLTADDPAPPRSSFVQCAVCRTRTADASRRLAAERRRLSKARVRPPIRFVRVV